MIITSFNNNIIYVRITILTDNLFEKLFQKINLNLFTNNQA